MKLASASPITFDANSGFVSRSRNWAMYFAAPTNSADFNWSGV